jgi:uncharacterized phage infection (PIP) family protein YhgE
MISCLAFLLSCAGGGTSGTGGIQFSGSVSKSLAKALNGEPLANVQVTLAETGESDVTDTEGRFEINSSATDLPTATLLIESAEIISSVLISDIPNNTRSVDVDLAVDLDAEIVSIVNIAIETEVDSAQQEVDDALDDAQSEVDDALAEAETEIEDAQQLVDDELGQVEDQLEDLDDQIQDAIDDALQDELGNLPI